MTFRIWNRISMAQIIPHDVSACTPRRWSIETECRWPFIKQFRFMDAVFFINFSASPFTLYDRDRTRRFHWDIFIRQCELRNKSKRKPCDDEKFTHFQTFCANWTLCAAPMFYTVLALVSEGEKVLVDLESRRQYQFYVCFKISNDTTARIHFRP